MILGANPLLALWREELPALELRDHRVDVRVAALRDGATDHLRGHEAVRREDVRHLPALLHGASEPVVDRILRRLVDVVRDERDARHLRAEHRVDRTVREARHDRRRRRHTLLLQCLPHLRAVETGPRDEDHVRVRILQLLRVRRQVGSAERHEQL